ncbi:Bacterial alpha-L-rhamnosidase [Cohnella sp. CFH 77786]|uniref:family 78 glycoside hydrolase catalytic domain n=1 Tax=Cohnella sp. CFH 77786 TaxID=2662265 RepID=UPI001C60A9A3|nr:family 78 glycoside hydrolase catalytic domain [Cohnella sp. CFH 77786]MBW5449078.1 Bacterial alpha-L-rhamnosidase [Cohnella sp. CFH 77786]
MDRKWSSSWIWGGTAESPRNEWRCFRGRFDCRADEAEGVNLHISADSRYVLYVNGVYVGRGPVRSWPKEQSYDTYAIGHLLRPDGDNTVAALVMHFGVSNFYYLRGRGGLLAEIERNGEVLGGTGTGWKTAKHEALQANSPRMSCQQGFAEVYDARMWDDRWLEPSFDDAGWQDASVIGKAGCMPWTNLRARDIPFLTEEKRYPASIAALSRVTTPRYSAVIDLRPQMIPGSVNHANPVGFTGYLATVLILQDDGDVTIGFPGGVHADGLWVDGLPCGPWTGEPPERYGRLRLTKGEHLVLIDVTTPSMHGWGFHLGIDGAVPFTMRSPLESGDGNGKVPFVAVGPFDTREDSLDDAKSRKLRTEDPEFVRAAGMSSAEQLLTLEDWIRPVDPVLYTEDDVFGANVWKTSAERRAVPPAYRNAILPVPEPAVISAFEEGGDLELVIDLGAESSGFVGFEVEAEEGTVLDVYGVEYWRKDYVQHTFGLDNTIRYVCREGRQRYESPVRRGLRYLILTIRNIREPVRIQEIYFRQSTYPVTDDGSFRCSDPLLGDIWEISRHTTRLCMEDTFVDCPAYEQVFWVGDSRNEALVNYYVFGATEIVKRCLKLVPGSGDVTPLYLDQVPSAWSSVIPNWTFFWAIACEEFASHTGDAAFAAEIWPSVRHTLTHYLRYLDESGLLNIKAWNLLDWAPMDQPDEGIVTHQNLFLVQALRKAALLAAAAGHAEEGSLFLAAANRLKDAINRHLWDEERQAYLDCIHRDGRRSEIFSMQTQVVAYLCGAAEGERRQVLEAYLAYPPAGFVPIGSPFMSFFYYEALKMAGQYDLMLDDIRKNYGRMIDHGATTCWEMYPNFAENRANPNMLTRSHCHAWSAAPGYFLAESILGVKMEKPGWEEAIIAPQPCGLAWANGRVPLPHGGHIEVEWTVKDGRIRIRAEAPDDVRLNVRIPEGWTGEVVTAAYRR